MQRLRRSKFWPTVSRVDDSYGDRNLVNLSPSPPSPCVRADADPFLQVCECGTVEEYSSL